MINIEKTDANKYSVTVSGDTITRHQVSLSDEYYNEIAPPEATRENLIKASFEFLLDREDNTSILRSFDLPVIEQFFPDYKETIKQYL